MVEMKASMFSWAIFVALIIPMFLMISVDSIHQHGFMKMTTEMSEIVKEEGGVTGETTRIANSLRDRGYTITFNGRGGNFGDTVHINYKYKYENVRGEKELKTQNKVVIMKR